MVKQISKHFGSAKNLAFLLGISKAAVSKWKINGISARCAIDIERLSEGKFKAVDIEGLK